jgi:hypothetical protein
MTAPATSFYATSDLGSWLLARFAQLEANRAPLDKKWQANQEAFEAELAVAWKAGEGQGWRATTCSHLVRNKVIGALSIMMDTALSGGRVPFMLAPFDVPPGMEAEAQARADAMEEHMRWQQEVTNEDRQLRRCALSGLIYGMGWCRRVVRPVKVRLPRQEPLSAFGLPPQSMGEMRWSYAQTEQAVPASDTPSIWNMFWDVEERDEDLMELIVERDFLTPHGLRKLTQDPGYLKSAIMSVLSEHPTQQALGGVSALAQGTQPGEQGTSPEEPRRAHVAHKTHSIRRLTFWGLAPRLMVEEFESRLELGEAAAAVPVVVDEPGDDVEVMAEICGREVIRFMRVERHERPYHFWLAEETLDEAGARGIADNARDAWIEETGYRRAALDNGNLAGNLIFTELPHLLSDDGEDKKLYPGVVKRGNEACDDIRKAFGVVEVPDITAALLNGQHNAQERGDEDSGVPRLIQGMAGIGAAATATEVQELAQRGMQTFGQFMKNFDDGRIEPMEQWRLEYNMDDPAHADKWGPFKVQALGFNSFQGRVIRFAKMVQMLQMILADATGQLAQLHNLRAVIEEIWKEMDVDPEQFLKSEQQLMQEQQADQMQAEQQAMLNAPAEPTPEEQAAAQAKTDETLSRAEMNRAGAAEKLARAGLAQGGGMGMGQQAPQMPMAPQMAQMGGY